MTRHSLQNKMRMTRMSRQSHLDLQSIILGKQKDDIQNHEMHSEINKDRFSKYQGLL
jgi:hypothetical protein